MSDEGDTERDAERERERGAVKERQREEWRDDVRKRRRRHRVLWGAAASMVVLGIAFLSLRPTVTDWWAARSVCDGALPDGAMDELRSTTNEPGADLKSPEEELDSQLGRWACYVENKEDERVLRVEAYTRKDDIDGLLAFDFDDLGRSATAALPAGLPGYEDVDGVRVVLLRDCPELGRDAAGRQRQLYVSVLAGYGARTPTTLRASVGVTNKAARKLGCGGRDLPVPEKGTRTKSVPPEKTRGTPCAALADGPLRGSEWMVDVQVSRNGPVSSCSVRPKGSDGGRLHRPLLQVTGWYGDWSRRLLYDQTDRVTGAFTETGTRPWMRESSGWAMARCAGVAANYTVWMRDDESTVGDDAGVTDLRKLRAMKGGQLRSLLAGFARQQRGQRGCEELRLPTEVVPDPPDRRR